MATTQKSNSRRGSFFLTLHLSNSDLEAEASTRRGKVKRRRQLLVVCTAAAAAAYLHRSPVAPPSAQAPVHTTLCLQVSPPHFEKFVNICEIFKLDTWVFVDILIFVSHDANSPTLSAFKFHSWPKLPAGQIFLILNLSSVLGHLFSIEKEYHQRSMVFAVKIPPCLTSPCQYHVTGFISIAKSHAKQNLNKTKSKTLYETKF